LAGSPHLREGIPGGFAAYAAGDPDGG
jgi:hypothetical protein